MRPPRITPVFAAAVLALVACGPAPEPKAKSVEASCIGPKMAACERDLASAASAGQAPAALLASYMKARAGAGPGDAWAALWEGMSDRQSARAAVVDERPEARALNVEGARVFVVKALPAPESIRSSDLLLSMARAAGYAHLVWMSADRVIEAFPRDPLGPQMLGVAPVIRDDAAPSHLEANLKIAEAVERALAYAGDFRYIDAAKEAARLSELVLGRDPFEEPVLRARYTRAMLSSAGITLEAPVRLFGDDKETSAPRASIVAPAPKESDTPYGDLLRVRTAEEYATEWKRRGPSVLSALRAELRPLADGFFGLEAVCPAAVMPPTFEDPAHLSFASLLPGVLSGAREEPIVGASAPALPLTEWYPRYERLVASVEGAHFFWLHATSLLRQRGEPLGLSASGTAVYKRVTALAQKHIDALRALSASDPERYQATAELGLAASPGVAGDEPLRKALIDLAQETTKAKLGRAQDPGEIAGALLLGGFVGLTYPEAIQSAHYLALQSAFAAKVKGDLMTKTGWGAAALFAIDAIVRVAFDLGPNLSFSSEQIGRALSAKDVAHPEVAAVVSAAVKYAALAKEKPLAVTVGPAQSTPERALAHEELRKAIAQMGVAGEAPPVLAAEIADLADGLIAVLSVVLHKKPPPAGTCAAKVKTSTDIEVEHALTKLRALRQKITQSPKWKAGDGLWARRARLLVSLLSDAMDFAAPAKPGEKRVLAVSAGEMETTLGAALREWDDKGAREALISAYSLARFFVAADKESRYSAGGPYLMRALSGLGRFLRGGEAASLPTLLDALAEMPAHPTSGDDLASAFGSYSKRFFEKGQPDQGEVFLLGTLLVSAIRGKAPPQEAIDLSRTHKSRLTWMLALFGEAAKAAGGGRPEINSYSEDARSSLKALCSPGRADDLLQVMSAVGQFSEGKRKEARAALDTVLDRADAEGLVVPKTNYQYSEKHDKKVFQLSFGLTHGAGFLEGGNTFQVGLGFSTLAERRSKLTVTAASASETAVETARYYVTVAALASAYHFLDGDRVRGAYDARRAALAIVSGLRLGPRSVTADRGRWAEDARSLLALDAQLAADAGLPFLSGDLWTIVKESLPPDADDAKIDAMLAEPPLGLAGAADAKAPLARAAKALRVVAAPLACTDAKVEVRGFAQVACEAYPLALGLRVADVLGSLPRLSPSADNAKGDCVALASLDGFLDSASRGLYDPDLFTRGVSELRRSGREDEAAALLARQRRDGHCSPLLVEQARALGRSQALAPSFRADMWTLVVNCGGSGAELEKDLVALDLETRKLPDPMRNLKVLFYAADLASRTGRPELLWSLVQDPAIVDRFLSLSGNAAAFALVLHHAAAALAATTPDLGKTEASYTLVCESFPSADRKAECDDVKALRDKSAAPVILKQRAKEALRRILAPPPQSTP